MHIPGDVVPFADFPDGAGVGIRDRGIVHVPGVEVQRCGAHEGESREEGKEEREQRGHGELHYDRIKEDKGRWTRRSDKRG